MNKVTIRMHLSYISLLNCRRNVDWIVSKHEIDLDNPEKVFYQSIFSSRQIKLDGHVSPNFKLELGVVKIQGGRDNYLDAEEKDAVKTLLVEENENVEEDEVDAEEYGNDDDSFGELLGPNADPRLGVRNQNQTSACINCNFIFGSCA